MLRTLALALANMTMRVTSAGHKVGVVYKSTLVVTYFTSSNKTEGLFGLMCKQKCNDVRRRDYKNRRNCKKRKRKKNIVVDLKGSSNTLISCDSQGSYCRCLIRCHIHRRSKEDDTA
ncbi:uncharacterized protein [Dysidea avara]|uniref:uncharacterized protein isoform X1 n=1 Tax=Dysidea avara TaxID=196820 RepID=UPI00332BDDE8